MPKLSTGRSFKQMVNDALRQELETEDQPIS